MITLTREEAQQVLDCLAFSSINLADEMTKTLRARLAQPEPKPVAWTVGGLITDFSRDFSAYKTKAYTRPLYTAPPQREWQGLTDKERNDCLVEADPCEALLDHEAHELMRTVEAKLKEKNGG